MTANDSGWMTLVSTCEILDAEALAADSQGPAPVQLPFALVEFRLPCASATMTVIYHNGADWNAGTGYWKYGPTSPGVSVTTKWYELPGVTFDTTTVGSATVARATFTLTDGQLGDDTGIDGMIVDQGGPGIPAESIPTAAEWALLLMAAILAATGLWRLRM